MVAEAVRGGSGFIGIVRFGAASPLTVGDQTPEPQAGGVGYVPQLVGRVRAIVHVVHDLADVQVGFLNVNRRVVNESGAVPVTMHQGLVVGTAELASGGGRVVSRFGEAFARPLRSGDHHVDGFGGFFEVVL